MKFATLILATAAAVSAGIVTPRELAPRQATTAAYCTMVMSTRCPGASNQASVATYCSSYLNVPKVTSTKTASAAAVTQRITQVQRPVVLSTVSVTAAATSTIRQTSTVNVLKLITASTTQITSITSTSTSSTTRTITTGTTTIGNLAITSTITSCAPTTVQGGQFTIMAHTGKAIGWKRDEEHELFKRQAIAKPTCFSRYSSASIISSACSCATISKQTVLTTTTITPTTTITTVVTSPTTSVISFTKTNTIFTTIVGTITNTITSTTTSTFVSTSSIRVNAVTTITSNVLATATVSPTTTIFVLAALPTFYIQNDGLNYAYLDSTSSNKKQKRAISGTIAFDTIPQSSAQLFTLPGLTGALADNAGNVVGEAVYNATTSDYQNIDVQLMGATDIATGLYSPVSCTIMGQMSDGTCPLDCQNIAASDVNQGDEYGNWMLGPPGVAQQETYNIFAVSPAGTTGATTATRHSRRKASGDDVF